MEDTALLPAKPQTIRAQVARYPLAAFVILAYAISWTCWLLMWLVDAGAVNGFGIIGATGPALAAMIVSAVQRPEPVGVPAGKRWRLLGLTLACVLAFLVVRRLWLAAGITVVGGRVTMAVV